MGELSDVVYLDKSFMDQGLSKSTGKSMYLSIVINVYLFVLIAQKKYVSTYL